jgi:hypothetical protein
MVHTESLNKFDYIFVEFFLLLLPVNCCETFSKELIDQLWSDGVCGGWDVLEIMIQCDTTTLFAL